MKLKLNRIYGLDSRSIILFRVVLGTMLLWHLVYYIGFNYTSIYAPSTGFLGNFLKSLPSEIKHPVSFINLFNSDWQTILFFAIYGGFIVLFILGKWINVVKFIVFFCFWSIQQAFPLSNNFTADIYFNTLLFIALLLPLKGSLFSIKQILNSEKEYRSPIVLPILIQIGCIYLFTAIAKSGWMWHKGVAANLLLGDFQLNNQLALPLLNKWSIIQFITYFTLIFEWIFIFLLFSPVFNRKFRLILSILLVAFHFGISIFANVGIFKLAALCVAILLLPNIFWNKFSESTKANFQYQSIMPKKAIIVFSIVLAFVIINQNFSKSLTYKNGYFESLNDTFIGKASNALRINFSERSSFLNQNWHLYAPNPPKESGYIDFQIGYSNSTISFLSNKLVEDKKFGTPLKRNDLRRFMFHNLKLKLDEPAGKEFVAIYMTYIHEELKRTNQTADLEFIQCVYYKPKMEEHKFVLPLTWEKTVIANWAPED